MLLISTIISVSLTTYLGFFILFKNKKNPTSIIFSILTFVTSLLAISNYYSLILFDKHIVLFFMRLVMFIAVIQSISFYLFTKFFPDNFFSYKTKYFIVSIVILVIDSIVIFSSLLFRDVVIYDYSRKPVVSYGIVFFILTVIIYLLLGFINLIKKVRKEKGIIQLQCKNILYGFCIMFALLLFFNFFLVVFLKNSYFVSFLPFFILPFLLFTAYSITRYRFMDINLVIKKGTAHLASLIVILSIYSGIIIFGQNILVQKYGWDLTWAIALTVLIISLSVEPLRKIVIKAVNNLIYNKQEKKRLLSREEARHYAQRYMAHRKANRELDDVLNQIVNEYLYFILPQEIKFLHYSEETKNFSCVYPENEEIYLDINDSVYKYLERNPNIIVGQEINYLEENIETRDRDLLRAVDKFMKKNRAEVLIPIGSTDNIAGIFLLGKKADKSIYTKEDIDEIIRFRNDYMLILVNVVRYKEAVERI